MFETLDFAPALPASKAESVALFMVKCGGEFQFVETSKKFLMLLSILDYIGTGTPDTYPMASAIGYQDGDGFLSETDSIDSPEPTIAEWLCHFAAIGVQEQSNGLLWGFAATLFENLRDEVA
ncbi:hypothetical protein H6F67_27230 [Microcoleus sp. FACHB-1515]|uniref:hypothetical protein n=1 Tax=Cyanophyceae TaxID=3028117 RepID=UPI0016888568|nr:hypothetical protein [Microcoleus sp. FACHB-1515]MBD2093532.1 hypothetical protein [Microcoleus sp. FACHB-1515]